MKKSFNKIFFTLFMLLWAGLIVINLITPTKLFSQSENKVLAQFPGFDMTKFIEGEFMEEIDLFINDQFIGRNQWIKLSTIVEIALNKQDINSVYLGKDGYLIERHRDSDVNQELAEKNIQTLIDFMTKTQGVLGVEHVKAMLVPSASQILTDKLPKFASGYDELEVINRLDQALPHSMIRVDSVLKAHESETIYYRTDHHWTSLGAYYGYQHWANDLGFDELDFDVKTLSETFLGTLHSKINLAVKADTLEQYIPQNATTYDVLINQTNEMSGLYDYDKLETKDQYGVFFGGNYGQIEITPSQGGSGNLLVIKDSFANAMVPMIVNHYEKTFMLDLRHYNGSVESFMAENDITDVLVLYNTMGFVKDITIGKLSR